MPGQALEIKCEFENVESITPCLDVMWRFDIEGPNGDTREGITIQAQDELELENGREFANFIMKWDKTDKQQAYVKIVDVKKAKKGAVSTYSTPGEFAPVAAFECRGLKITKYHPGTDFDVTLTNGQKFTADLVNFAEDPDWYDVNDNNESVSVTEMEVRITNFKM